MCSGNFLKDAASSCARTRKAPVTKWAVGNHSDTVLLTPRNYGVLDRPLPQMVEDLIADETVLTSNLPDRFQVGHIEVAHAPCENLSLALKLLEGRDRLL